MAVICLLRVWISRRHDNRCRDGVLLAATGAARRGRPDGGSGILAGFFEGTTPYDIGLIELALSPLGVADALRDVVRPLCPNVSFVAGTRTHAQAPALGTCGSRSPLRSATRGQRAGRHRGCGRLGLAGSPQPLLQDADLTLLLTRGASRDGGGSVWAETVGQPTTGWLRAGSLMIGEGQPYRDSEVTKVLGMPVVANLPDDPEAAAVYHRGAPPPRHFETGPYVRSLQAAAQSIQAEVARGRFALVEESAR